MNDFLTKQPPWPVWLFLEFTIQYLANHADTIGAKVVGLSKNWGKFFIITNSGNQSKLNTTSSHHEKKLWLYLYHVDSDNQLKLVLA